MARIPAGAVLLTGGTYNTVYQLGPDLIVKVAPPAGTPRLTYEHGLLATEAAFYRAAAGLLPVPKVVSFDGDTLVMSRLPGASTESPVDRVRLGEHVAALHTVTGTGFGYPHRGLHPTWRGAFESMMADLLADARRYEAPLPRKVLEIEGLISRTADVLDAVTVPRLVHFDLWPGNILIDGGRISGIIDGERSFWGDPIAELVSLALFGDITADRAFLTGYDRPALSGDEIRRLALYRTYLYLIMLVETIPRGHDGPPPAIVVENLERALTDLRG